MTRIVFTGGGTGGHIYPALAIAEGVRKRWPDSEIRYIGAKGSMESRVVSEAGYPFMGVSAEGWQGRKPLKLAGALMTDIKGYKEASAYLDSFKPDLVIGTGGYVSLPVGLAAAAKRIPLYIHEQNALPGLTNKFLALRAKRIMLTFEEAAKRFPLSSGKKAVLTGLPVRASIVNADPDEALAFFNLDRGKKTILATGGSQGAAAINKAMLHVIGEVYQDPDIQVILAAGARGFRQMTEALSERKIKWDAQSARESNIRMYPYIDRMDLAYAIADIFVGRSGASFLAEISLRKLPAILIPLPGSAENHQYYNAQSLVNKGGAIMFAEKNLSGPSLYEALMALISDPEKLSLMGEGAYKAARGMALEAILDVISAEMK